MATSRMRPPRRAVNCEAPASTRWPSQVKVRVVGSRVASTRSGRLPSWPSWSTWASSPTGNRALVMRVGSENRGLARSTRALSGAIGRQPVPCSFSTHALAAGPPAPVVGAGAPAPPAPVREQPATRAIASPGRARRRAGAGSSVGALVGLVLVGLLVDDLEAAVEVDLDLAAVVEADLDPVGGAVVAGLGLQHSPAAGGGQGGRDR